MIDRTRIESLTHGECYTVPKSDYGKAEIYKINDCYIVFEIPEYGGTPFFSFCETNIDYVIKSIESWT